jgi:hypothetical protein
MNFYSAIVMTNTLASSKNSSTPSVEIQVQTTKNLSDGTMVRKTLTGNLWLTAKAAERTMETLAHVFGWAGDSLQELNLSILQGIECEVVTEDEPYEGKTYEKVKFFNKVGESGARAVTPLEDAHARQIATQYDSVLRSFKAKGGKTSTPTKAALPAPAPQFESESGFNGNDDLPWDS